MLNQHIVDVVTVYIYIYAVNHVTNFSWEIQKTHFTQMWPCTITSDSSASEYMDGRAEVAFGQISTTIHNMQLYFYCSVWV